MVKSIIIGLLLIVVTYLVSFYIGARPILRYCIMHFDQLQSKPDSNSSIVKMQEDLIQTLRDKIKFYEKQFPMDWTLDSLCSLHEYFNKYKDSLKTELKSLKEILSKRIKPSNAIVREYDVERKIVECDQAMHLLDMILGDDNIGWYLFSDEVESNKQHEEKNKA
jgi:hypothetical protein